MKEINSKYQDLLETIMQSEILNEREMALIALTVATVTEDTDALKNSIEVAKEAGISVEETDYINMVIALLKAQKVVASKPVTCCCGTNSIRCC